MREVVFDTETTGLDAAAGDRIVQIGALELMNHIPTGRTYMTLVQPDRPMDPRAEAVHGIGDAMLRDQPRFAEIVDDVLAFVEDAPLVAHNAEFDRAFFNAELALVGYPELPAARFVDTLAIARAKLPGQRLSLDALCRQFGIDTSMREKHDALVDCRILAQVYLELKGGRQHGLGLGPAVSGAGTGQPAAGTAVRQVRPARPHAASAEEEAAHHAFLATLDNPLWLRPGRD